MTVCVGRDGVFGGGVLSERPSPSSRTVTVNHFAGAGGLFLKVSPASQGAQNSLAGCIFVGVADKNYMAQIWEAWFSLYSRGLCGAEGGKMAAVVVG